MSVPAEALLTTRWTPLRPHQKQRQIMRSEARFISAFCGRQSGKTEVLAKRKALARIFDEVIPGGRYLFAEPIYRQAKNILWGDLKQMIPRQFIRRIREADLTIELVWGAELFCMGMDSPDRVEGTHLNGACLDEFASMKKGIFELHIRPMLDSPRNERPGWCNFSGTPEGRNHAYEFFQHGFDEKYPDWESYNWPSEDIMDPAVIAAAKAELDELTYSQEYLGSFINFAGRAYYAFSRETHAAEKLPYDPQKPLMFTFDFNVSPGTAAVAQDMSYTGKNPDVDKEVLGVIGEVWIPRNSNTPAVCRKLVADWGKHQGPVWIFGDPSGGSRGTAKVAGSDWDLVREELKGTFGDHLSFRVKKANPPQRACVNALNSRIRSTDGKIRLLVDPSKAPHVVEDFEGVTLLEGGSGELDKDKDEMLTHLSDGLSYLCEYRFPIGGPRVTVDYVF